MNICPPSADDVGFGAEYLTLGAGLSSWAHTRAGDTTSIVASRHTRRICINASGTNAIKSTATVVTAIGG